MLPTLSLGRQPLSRLANYLAKLYVCMATSWTARHGDGTAAFAGPFLRIAHLGTTVARGPTWMLVQTTPFLGPH